MRLLFIHQYFATPAGWGSQRMYEFGRRFVATGHSVDVLCCAAYDHTLVGRRLVESGGMRVHVSRTHYRPQMGFVARVWSFAGFMFFSLWHVLRRGREYDLIVASSGPLTTAVPALLARWLYGRPFVFEVLDVWPDAAIDAGVLRNGLLKRLAFALEACAYRWAWRVVTCSSAMTTRVLRKGVPKDKVSTIPHGSDLDVFKPDTLRRDAVRDELGVRDDQTVVLYAGAMGRSNAIDDVVRTMTLTVSDPRIVWWFAGDGAEAEKIRQQARSTVRFFDAVSRQKIVDLHQGADVALVTFMHAPVFYENSPNKAFDAFGAGLPVLFNRSTWLEPEINRYGCGFVCKGENPVPEMSEKLRLLADDPELRQRMGAGARRLAEKVFSRDRLAETYLKILEGAGSSEF